MENQLTTFSVQWVREETAQMRLISLNSGKVWSFIPGQVAILRLEGVGESYYAIASAPEDKGGMEFLIHEGAGVSKALFEIKKGAQVQAKGPVGKGFPIDNYPGRDFVMAAVGSAVAPLRGVLRSISRRRSDFKKVAFIYGVRHPDEFAFPGEVTEWRKSNIEVIQIVSRPEGTGWTGKTGHVQSQFGEAIRGFNKPIAMICGMKPMLEQSRQELVRLGLAEADILTNF
ncbi:MAG: FAD-binding oxidoreductase [Dehalococcoidia bacterium]|nr:FAD-binding oxidoreductase [Dehalococcoidia bacterium]